MANCYEFKGFVEHFIGLNDTNPFEDGSDFDNFIPANYNSISDELISKTNLNTPLNIYKYLLLKLYDPFKIYNHFTPGLQTFVCCKKLENLKEMKKIYKNFRAQNVNVNMTEKEESCMKAALATLELAEICAQIEGYALNPATTFRYQKFKNICVDIVFGFAAEVPLVHLTTVFSFMLSNKYHEVCRFILIVMNEIIIKIRKIRSEKGMLQDSKMVEMVNIAEMKLLILKIDLLNSVLLQFYDVFSIGMHPMSQSYDNQKIRLLMTHFPNYRSNDEFNIALFTYISFEHAKVIYELILDVISKVRLLTKELNELTQQKFIAKCKFIEASVHGNFSLFQNNQVDAYKFCEKSCDVIQTIDSRDSLHLQNKDFAFVAMLNRNLSSMWKGKLEIYDRDKTEENLNALKEIATKRINYGNYHNFHSQAQTIHEIWNSNMDMFSCYLYVFKDDVKAMRCAEMVFHTLSSYPNEIPLFIRSTGVVFEITNTLQHFTKALFKRFKFRIQE